MTNKIEVKTIAINNIENMTDCETKLLEGAGPKHSLSFCY